MHFHSPYEHQAYPNEAVRQGRWYILLLFEFLVLVGLLIGGYYVLRNHEIAERQTTDVQEEAFAEQTPPLELVGSDYQQVWEENKLPNVTPASAVYDIYGHATADAYIRQQAENRGYRQQPVAQDRTKLTTAQNYRLQTPAAASWQELERDARESGITLELTSGFRDVEEQRRLFQQFFQQYNNGNSPDLDRISSGVYDSVLEQTLGRVAPPGYSKHHSGYIIDVGDGAQQRYATNFRGSAAQQWLSRDNYAAARSAGFVPSYPDDVSQQGPNPEPWEFAWVGERSLHYDAIVEAWTSTN